MMENQAIQPSATGGFGGHDFVVAPRSLDVAPLVGPSPANPQREMDEFFPREPKTLPEAGLLEGDVEALVMKCLLNFGTATGRRVAEQLRLPFPVLQELLYRLKAQLLVGYKASAPMSDYEYELSVTGLERARRYNDRCTYFGVAPVPLDDYIESVHRQSIRKERPRFADIRRSLQDLVLPTAVISQIGQAVNAGRGLFLYGSPGNGKTSIAERIMGGLNKAIWIPRTITVGSEIIRMFDPSHHQELPLSNEHSPILSDRFDRRWVRICRPTVIVGGELTLANLEITTNAATGINESPLQFKSNCGALVVDDFGRQRCTTTELINRWIVPLEKGHDYLALPSGRQIQVPFDQLLVFSTNLEPRQLVDEAFLRRIPFKIEVFDPTEQQFRDLFQKVASEMRVEYRDDVISDLIEKHFKAKNRPLRYCYVRDLLLQVRNFCEFHERPFELSHDTFEIAVNNYFAGL